MIFDKFWHSSPEKEQKRRELRLEKIKAGKLKRNELCALCLGGGGARGFAHVGAIKAFEEAGFEFDIVVGTSVGSLVGALYAGGVTADEMMKIGQELDAKAVHNGNIFRPNDPYKIGKIATDILGDVTIEQIYQKTGRRFGAVAVDLVSASQEIMTSGRVMDAISASSCVPLFFKPVETEDGKHLVDGGVLNNIPYNVCKMLGATDVIAVDVNPTRGQGSDKTGTLGVVKAVFGIMCAQSSQEGIRGSDVVISVDTSEFSSGSKNGYEEMAKRGYETAKEMLYDVSLKLYK